MISYIDFLFIYHQKFLVCDVFLKVWINSLSIAIYASEFVLNDISVELRALCLLDDTLTRRIVGGERWKVKGVEQQNARKHLNDDE